jgi:ABC-2 family transporter protein
MIRFAWLQSRTQALVALIGLVGAAVVLLITGPNLVHLYDTVIAPCTTNGDCSPTTISLFLQHQNTLRLWLGILVVVIPGLIGVFWGAPLVARELETGTYRLAWTQSVSRTRWLAAKIGMVALAAMATAGLFSFMVTWWSSPQDIVRQTVYEFFDQRDIVPIGHAAFGFALGVTAGVFIRRTLPAMATVAVAFTAVRVAVSQWVRPHLFSPTHLTLPLEGQRMGMGFSSSGSFSLEATVPNIPNAWFYPTQIVDNAGHALTSELLVKACPTLAAAAPKPVGNRAQVPADLRANLLDCVTTLDKTYHQLVSYQPASRYWAFQWYEMAIYLGAAVVLAGLCIWSVRRRS